MKENAWQKYTESDLKELETITESYKRFLTNCKTERECVKEITSEVEQNGFKDLKKIIASNENLEPGDKIYVNNRGKAIALFVIGKKDITEGMNILGAHIDSPRLDVKANAIYEELPFAYFDTHYYGGIKKYQWVTIPLSIHGTVVRKDGRKIEIKIGEDENDPAFIITDLLIHLSREQLKSKASEVIEGENLDILISSRPLMGEEKEKVKANVLKILKDKYEIEEDDLISAEIEIVPSGAARDCGLDRSMIMAYGQDDRVCAYTALKSFLKTPPQEKTISCILVDKEEIGSVGSTGMHSTFYENAVLEIASLLGKKDITTIGRIFSNSYMLSNDVNAGYDPLYKTVMDKKNSSFFGNGLTFCKYTGSGGKSGSNDADCEYLAKLRKIMDDNNVSYQVSELGKVDAGGGGTIAYILANKNINVIDCGIGLLNMHAPFEIASKSDIYEMYRGNIAFLSNI